jgi:hypothetical protein
MDKSLDDVPILGTDADSSDRALFAEFDQGSVGS